MCTFVCSHSSRWETAVHLTAQIGPDSSVISSWGFELNWSEHYHLCSHCCSAEKSKKWRGGYGINLQCVQLAGRSSKHSLAAPSVPVSTSLFHTAVLNKYKAVSILWRKADFLVLDRPPCAILTKINSTATWRSTM